MQEAASSPRVSPSASDTRAVAAKTWWQETRALLALAAPLTFAYLGSIAITTTDVVMMGWLGPEKLAAGSLGHNLMFPLFLLGLGVVVAVTPMVAQSIGAGEVQAIRRTFQQGLWAAVFMSLPFGLILWNGRTILIALGQDPSVAALSETYLHAVLWSLVPSFGHLTLRNFLTAHSLTKAVVVTQFVAVVLNCVGNYGLMFGHFGLPRLELAGAGVSTTLVQLSSFAILLGYTLRRPAFRHYKLLQDVWRPDWARFFELIRIGLPIGLAIIAESTLFAGAAMMMGLLGTAPLAAQAIAVQCVAIAFMVPLSISHATMVRVAVYAGAGDRAGLSRVGLTALGLGLAVMLAIAVFFVSADRTIAKLFLDPTVPGTLEVQVLVGVFLLYAAFAQLADGTQVILAGILRGVKDTTAAMWFSFIGFWGVGLSAAYGFGIVFDLGAFGIWLGLIIGIATVGLLAFIRVWRAGMMTFRTRP